jgi:hypothetical protein
MALQNSVGYHVSSNYVGLSIDMPWLVSCRSLLPAPRKKRAKAYTARVSGIPGELHGPQHRWPSSSCSPPGFRPHMRWEEVGSRVDVAGTNKEEIKVSIPFKLVGMHEALEKIGLFLKTLLMKAVNPRVFIRDLQKLIWIKYNSLLKKLLLLILMLYLKILDFHFLRLAQRR